MPATVKLFIGGFGDSWFSGIVESYAAAYHQLNPDVTTQYFNFQQSVAIAGYLRGVPSDAQVTVVGHSWGADTAFSAVKKVPVVATLISIDPVAWSQSAWTDIRPHCTMWLNVRAEPSAARRDTSDRIAAIGTKYPRPPAAGQPGAPNYAYAIDATHGEFRRMMRLAPPGCVSGSALLGGHSVG